MNDLNKLDNYIADKPILSKEQDRFQRYPFAQRIAETILTRKSKDSIVLGLFGDWGEGKSSVINFIQSEIEEKNENFIQVKFNPWRFADEGALLASFFNILAKEIKITALRILKNDSIRKNKFQVFTSNISKIWDNSKDPLQTNLEKAGELMSEYGKIASFVGLGDTAESIGKIISDTDIETLKSRIENLLSETKIRIVIYLDDIDRLDKNEIYSIFRLVKLTGDFSYTSYILSFDEKMVASAIGERFGEGNKKAGENFLEKIIQVPLQIPKAHTSALKEYSLELIENSLKLNKVELNDMEMQRFLEQFSTNILPKLKTPRFAVRYANSLAFTIPLLKNEVNIVDLLLIQAVNIFYPVHYKFIKNNPEYFIETYGNLIGGGKNEYRINRFKEHLEIINKELSDKDQANSLALLKNLFPILEGVFSSYHSTHTEYYNNWYKDKNIASADYFDRYFSFTVLKGDISDVTFKNFIKKLESEELENLDLMLNQIIKSTDKKIFVTKLKSFENEIDWNSSKKLAYLLSDNIEQFSNKNGFMGINYGTPFSDAALIIYRLIKKHDNKEEQMKFAKHMMSYPRFDFAYSINNWLRTGRTKEEKIFTDDEYLSLAKILVDRAKSESKNSTIFDKFPNYIGFLVHCWKQTDENDYNQYINHYLEQDKENILILLESFMPMQTIIGKPEPYRSDIDERTFDNISKNIDPNLVMKRIEKLEAYTRIDQEELYWDDFGEKEYKRVNMLRQFKHWFEKRSIGNIG